MTSDVPDTITVVSFPRPHKIGTPTVPVPKLKDGDFFVKALYSGISAGTELTFFLGTNPKTSEGWDETHRLFRGDVEPDAGEIYPMLKGYMQTGIVTASKNPKVKVGSIVGGKYGHTTGHVMTKDDFWILLPDNLDPMLGVIVPWMGPICMNGILYAADDLTRTELKTLKGSLTGQRVMVFGAGMVGVLTGLFAKWAGAREVGIVDGIPERLEIAKKLGFKPFLAKPTLALDVKKHWHTADPLDTGADIAFQCTGSDFLLHQAFSCLREQGTVIDMGFYQQGAAQVLFGKEFHHNRLRHICAQIGAMPRHQQQYWDRVRLAGETITFLQEYGDIIKEHVITHVLPFTKAQHAYDHLAERDPKMLQVILQANES
ncbi:MAG TPA: zinc-binding alcohol dehydrogenase [Candidatus Saccharimonadales bacterium]|nr:zinc-binding alcohol dehydrogenase [Candidatus Saccharimonadales bacterium]